MALESTAPQANSGTPTQAAQHSCVHCVQSITITDGKLQQLLTDIRSTAIAAKRSGEDAAQKGQRVIAACDMLLTVLKIN